MTQAAIARLRFIGLLEGLSFLVLLGVAMPLKYLAHEPWAVKVFGWAHGVLFVAYLWAAQVVRTARGWDGRRTAWAVVASLLPLGTFVFDRSLRAEAEALAAAGGPTEGASAGTGGGSTGGE